MSKDDYSSFPPSELIEDPNGTSPLTAAPVKGVQAWVCDGPQAGSIVDVYRGAHAAPVVQSLGIRCTQVDTAVAHWRAEIGVPICAVDRVIPVEIHDIWHVGQIIVET